MSFMRNLWIGNSSNEVKFISNRQDLLQNATKESTTRKKESNKKRVRFACPTTIDNNQQLNDTFYPRPSINKSEQLCSVRGIMIVAVIAGVLLIGAAIAIGSTFALNSSSNSATDDAHRSRVSMITVLATAMTSYVIIGNQSGLPCLSYTTINDPSRNVNNTGSDKPCDNDALFNGSNGRAWIRFIGSGGKLLASRMPGYHHCGAYTPVWFNETLPTTVGTTSYGAITAGRTLWIIFNISVMYCTGNFYIYNLPPINICNSRYCTE